MSNETKHTPDGKTERLTVYAPSASGARRIGLTVMGVHVLVEPSDFDQQALALSLASRIAALGPAEIAADAPARVLAEQSPAKQPSPDKPKRMFQVGDKIWCTVRGAEGVYTVTEVGVRGNKGRVKVREFRGWCPVYNFISMDDRAAEAGKQ